MLTSTRIIALAAVLALGGTTLAQAQVTIGPRIGLNLADISFKFEDIDDADLDTKLLVAPQAGITLNAAFGNLALQPSLLFSQKGTKVTVDESSPGFSNVTETTARLNYLELPVNLVYTTGGTEGFQVFAGPYIGFGLGGKIKQKYTVSQSGTTISESESYKVKFASKSKSNSDAEYFNQPDFGVNGGVGYKTGPFQVQAGYSLGLNNMVPKDSDGAKPDSKSHNRVIQFSLSYFFGSN
ncbi:porin family protein [Hymenobacter psychrophilus]|uniref:Outer membrane protein beta-barrel domain-containing protein n=1 Tax=Hymenobacter psychrophilus TaxID=651662 RepID=A0A1H3M6S0_9BACT|nr:porin family protein [Hymenobacter psychrophilus]SDY72283.1 Outer membrane protein beta-barrel domain-containing protein [Hymenobacter psychrophilus]